MFVNLFSIFFPAIESQQSTTEATLYDFYETKWFKPEEGDHQYLMSKNYFLNSVSKVVEKLTSVLPSFVYL